MKSQELVIEVEGITEKALIKQLQELSGSLNDSTDLFKKLRAMEQLMMNKGYLLSEGILSKTDSNYTLSIAPGKKLYAREIRVKKPKDLIIPEQTALPNREKLLYKGRLTNLVEQELQFLENNGYPFARIHVEEFEIINDSALVIYALESGPRVLIDSIVVKGFDGFPKNFLRYDLELKKGMPYNEKLLSSLNEKAARVEYLKMKRKPALAFTISKTILYLYLEEVKANQVDGVIGINTTEEGTVTFNGDFHLRLLNTIKKGEELELRWRRPDQSIQSLDLDINTPYLFRTPIGMQAGLSIFRQDSSFVNSDFRAYLNYLLQSGSSISIGVNLRSSNVLDAGADAGFTSFSTVHYQLGMNMNRTNRAIIPTSGYRWRIFGTTGKRSISDQTQEQYSFQITSEYYAHIKRHVLALAVNSSALFGEDLFLNEIYRIGGLKTLRGFNEQSIFSSAYAIGTIEYRFMIGEFDYITLFSDLAWSETNTNSTYSSDFFTGLGTGLNFNTSGGIFSLFFALGKDQSQPFDLRTAKVHFGYISRF